MSKERHTYFFVVVFAAALLTYLPPALVNEAPFWDDKAYINNALIASGRIEPSKVWGPFAEERPPLFWWLLTAVYLTGSPVEWARLVSPLMTSLGVAAIYLLTAKIFRSVSAGLLTSLIMVFLDYFVLTTSYILTDAFGSVLAFLTILCFGLGLRFGPYMWVAGSLLAASIVARDQNMLLIPCLILSMVWVARAPKWFKLFVLSVLAATAYLALSMSQEVFLQRLSDIITPVILDRTFAPFLVLSFLFAVMAVYKVYEQKNLLSARPSIGERSLDIFLGIVVCVVLLYPFFIDNVRLGDEFQIAGKGVLSRPVSHSIMVRDGITKQGLNTVQRIVAWSTASVELLTLPLVLLSAAGCLLTVKNGVAQARPAIVWAAVTIPYVFVFTHLEYRFLVQAVPPMSFLAAYAISRVAAWNKYAGAAVAFSLLFFIVFPSNNGLTPTFESPTFVKGWKALAGESTPSEKWLTDYVMYLRDVAEQPRLTISLANVVSACAVIPSLLSAVYLGLRRGLLY
ncbi:MAG: glycosyltransferase family 39 protein [Candidatus Caldarchaeum sp.]